MKKFRRLTEEEYSALDRLFELPSLPAYAIQNSFHPNLTAIEVISARRHLWGVPSRYGLKHVSDVKKSVEQGVDIELLVEYIAQAIHSELTTQESR